SSTSSQLSLSAGAGISQWTFRNAGGNLYLSTTTVAGTATSTQAALTITNSGALSLGTTTAGTLRTNSSGVVYVDTSSGTAASSTLFSDTNTFSGINTFTGLLTNTYASSTYSSFGTASTTNLIINGESFNDLTGTGLALSGNTL